MGEQGISSALRWMRYLAEPAAPSRQRHETYSGDAEHTSQKGLSIAQPKIRAVNNQGACPVGVRNADNGGIRPVGPWKTVRLARPEAARSAATSGRAESRTRARPAQPGTGSEVQRRLSADFLRRRAGLSGPRLPWITRTRGRGGAPERTDK